MCFLLALDSYRQSSPTESYVSLIFSDDLIGSISRLAEKAGQIRANRDMSKSPKVTRLVFVYGTLKRGEPNYDQHLGENGVGEAQFSFEAVTAAR